MNSERNTVLSDAEAREYLFLKKVYLWMASALVVTGAAAYLVASSEKIMFSIYSNPVLLVLMIIAEFAFVAVLSGKIERLKVSTAFFLFYGYALLNGMMLSSVVYLYSGSDILPLSFGTTAAVFAAASLYGALTKKSIKGWGGWLSMALLALVIASAVNMFLASSRLDWIISLSGVVIFTLLTAWDTRKIADMNMSYGYRMDEGEMNRISLLGALELYLDFVNILLYIIRIYGSGRRKD